MNGPGQSGLGDLRRQRQRHADKTFHVTGATAVELATPHFRFEGIAGPVLAVHRHDIGMARQHNAAIAFRAETGEKIGFLAAGIRREAAARTRFFQQRLYEGD